MLKTGVLLQNGNIFWMQIIFFLAIKKTTKRYQKICKILQKNTNYVKIDLNKYREKPIEAEYIEEILTVNKIKVITTIEEEIIPADPDERFNNTKPS